MPPTKVTAANLASAINRLPKDRAYDYISARTTTKMQLVRVQLPEGPITIKRWDPVDGAGSAEEATISVQMLWRVANAISPGCPISIERILGGSYNTRSALESLMALTPEFYFCYPGRIECQSATSKVKHGHKHLMWNPDEPHPQGVISEAATTGMVISEVPTAAAIYEALVVPDIAAGDARTGMSMDDMRRHAQMQIALIMIGRSLGSRTWVAQNDKGIVYKGTPLGDMEGVIASLDQLDQIRAHEAAVRSAQLIDCIWFRNSRFMPAVFEVEHSTGVTSGLSRMKSFKDAIPPINSKWVVVAPDALRDKVFREANKPQFADLQARFFSYSAVEELYSLCQRRRIRGVNDEFLDCFMEPCITPAAVA